MRRTRIVLACGAGETNAAISKRMGVTGMAVGKWHKRYLDPGLAGLCTTRSALTALHTHEEDRIASVIDQALQTTAIWASHDQNFPGSPPPGTCDAGNQSPTAARNKRRQQKGRPEGRP